MVQTPSTLYCVQVMLEPNFQDLFNLIKIKIRNPHESSNLKLDKTAYSLLTLHPCLFFQIQEQTRVSVRSVIVYIVRIENSILEASYCSAALSGIISRQPHLS
jgi:hypothetical protein